METNHQIHLSNSDSENLLAPDSIQHSSVEIYGGIEGGSTTSKIVLMNKAGDILASITDAPSTNYLLLSSDEFNNRVFSLVESAKKQASIPSEVILDSLCLCLSGCEEGDQGEFNKFLANTIKTAYPKLARHITTDSDIFAPLFTALPKGGIVLISGTGSNCLLYNPDKKHYVCGGLGHVLGDEGSAYWITIQTIQRIFHHDQNLSVSPFCVEKARQIILKYFNVTYFRDIFKSLYSDFIKSHIAGACVNLAMCAEDDPFIRQVFRDAGLHLGRYLKAVSSKIDKILLEEEGGLLVACVGSVFKSWKFLREGILEGIDNSINEITFVWVTACSAVGAANLGAINAGKKIDIKYEDNRRIIEHYKLY